MGAPTRKSPQGSHRLALYISTIRLTPMPSTFKPHLCPKPRGPNPKPLVRGTAQDEKTCRVACAWAHVLLRNAESDSTEGQSPYASLGERQDKHRVHGLQKLGRHRSSEAGWSCRRRDASRFGTANLRLVLCSGPGLLIRPCFSSRSIGR